MPGHRDPPAQRLMSSASVMLRSLGKATRITLKQILQTRGAADNEGRRTRIVCTMGPSCNDEETLVNMIDAGMNVARLNFSHGTHETHLASLKAVQAAVKRRPNSHVAILLDTKGPEVRTGMLKDGNEVTINRGSLFKLTTDYEHIGDETCIGCSYGELVMSVGIGSFILIGDGALACTVVEKMADGIMVRAENTAVLGERKNMNLPKTKVELPCIGPKDEKDILEFGIPNKVAFIAPSFVQSAEDVRIVRRLLGSEAGNIRIIAKIENVEGLMHFDEILEEADGVMIARGDLGMEIYPEKVFLAQKMVISKCNVAGKPVITATQMLESMTKNPRPTRAEVADVANAVLDGSDCVMLSGETAGGLYPVDAVRVMASTCLEAEACIDYDQLYQAMVDANPGNLDSPEAVARAAVSAANAVDAALIIVLTETGYTARLIAKYRPQQLILTLSSSEATIQNLCVQRGVITLHTPSFQGSDSVIKAAIAVAKERYMCEIGDQVIAVHGMREDCAGGANVVKVLEVD